MEVKVVVVEVGVEVMMIEVEMKVVEEVEVG